MILVPKIKEQAKSTEIRKISKILNFLHSFIWYCFQLSLCDQTVTQSSIWYWAAIDVVPMFTTRFQTKINMFQNLLMILITFSRISFQILWIGRSLRMGYAGVMFGQCLMLFPTFENDSKEIKWLGIESLHSNLSLKSGIVLKWEFEVDILSIWCSSIEITSKTNSR